MDDPPEIQKLEITLDATFFEDVWVSSSSEPESETKPIVYRPGGIVEGSIQLVVVEPYRFSGIYLRGSGEMVIAFNGEDTEGFRNNYIIRQNMEFKEHSASKEYVILPRKQILGVPGQIQCLPPGDHQFPFKFELPTSIPSSFSGRFGFIEYWLEVSIDQSPYGHTVIRKQSIELHGVYDLSADSTALVPVEHTEEENYCCLCCTNGAYGFTFTLNKKGFTHGERIKPRIQLRNGTPTETEATLKIKKEIVYEINPSTTIKDEKEQIGESSMRVDVNSTHDWDVDILLGDNLLPSVFNHCSYIHVDYKLVFVYQPTGCNCDSLTYDLPLLLGHLPASYATYTRAIMTSPDQTYVYPQIDLTSETQPMLPPPPYEKGGNSQLPYSEKGGNTQLPYSASPAQPSAPPIMTQPYSAPQPFADDARPPPPSYRECFMMTDMSGQEMSQPSTSTSYGVSHRQGAYTPEEEEKTEKGDFKR